MLVSARTGWSWSRRWLISRSTSSSSSVIIECGSKYNYQVSSEQMAKTQGETEEGCHVSISRYWSSGHTNRRGLRNIYLIHLRLLSFHQYPGRIFPAHDVAVTLSLSYFHKDEHVRTMNSIMFFHTYVLYKYLFVEPIKIINLGDYICNVYDVCVCVCLMAVKRDTIYRWYIFPKKPTNWKVKNTSPGESAWKK